MYRWIDHTAEVELEIEAADEEEVFGDALAAFRELLGEPPAEEEVVETIVVDADERAGLLAEWIEELAFLAETRGFIPSSPRSLSLQDAGLRAEVAGSIGSPPHVVKAVTYHRLGFEFDGKAYRARVILDV